MDINFFQLSNLTTTSMGCCFHCQPNGVCLFYGWFLYEEVDLEVQKGAKGRYLRKNYSFRGWSWKCLFWVPLGMSCLLKSKQSELFKNYISCTQRDVMVWKQGIFKSNKLWSKYCNWKTSRITQKLHIMLVFLILSLVLTHFTFAGIVPDACGMEGLTKQVGAKIIFYNYKKVILKPIKICLS